MILQWAVIGHGKEDKKKWFGAGRNGQKPNLRSNEIGGTRRPVTCPLGGSV